MAQNELVFAPLGGIGEIGMNLSIYGFGDERRRQWLIVDCGVSFASEELLPGVDLILPDIRFLIEQRKNIVGLVLTHGHEDHIGALIDLWPRLKVPLYATPFTAALFEAKRLSATMRARIGQWDRGNGFAAILGDWLGAARGIGEEIRVRNGGSEKIGRFVGLDQSGRLVLLLADGNIEKISAGDVFPFAKSGGQRIPSRAD